jgi:predicted RNase H-like nuclease (RuvC/YqgF family)
VHLKAERLSMHTNVAQQRYYVKKMYECYKQRLATNADATEVAKDRTKKLAETVDSLNQQLEYSRKSLKVLEEALKSISRIRALFDGGSSTTTNRIGGS